MFQLLQLTKVLPGSWDLPAYSLSYAVMLNMLSGSNRLREWVVDQQVNKLSRKNQLQEVLDRPSVYYSYVQIC